MRLFLDAGHGGIDPGAVARHDGVLYREKDLAWDFVVRVRAEAKKPEFAGRIEIKVVDKSNPETQSPRPGRFRARVAQSVAWGASHFVSVHWNASAGDVARGTEVFYRTGDKAGEAFGANLSRRMAVRFSNRNRGAKPESMTRHKRLGILQGHDPRCIPVLLEVGFITSAADVANWVREPDAIARHFLRSVLGDPL